MKRRTFLAGPSLALGLQMPFPSLAQTTAWPSRPVKLTVPFAPGGTSDILGRMFAQKMGETFGQTVVVENRSGAGGALGAAAVARAEPDGYNLLLGTIGSHSVNPILVKETPYHPERDFAPVSLLATAPMLLVVNPSLPITDLASLIRYAKANPGKLSYASDGNGSVSHLTSEMFRKAAGIDIVHVPYRGSAPAMTDLIAGQVGMKFDFAPVSLPHIAAGKLRGIATTGATRSKSTPGLPTVAEAGLPGFKMVTWWALYAPRNTSPEIVNRVHGAVAAAAASSETAATGLSVDLVASTPEALASFQREDIEHWTRIVREMNIKAG